MSTVLDDPVEQLAIYQRGWVAMEWLSRHAKERENGFGCAQCAAYRRATEQPGAIPSLLVGLRCREAQEHHAAYMDVVHMRRDLTEEMTCDLASASPRHTPCSGPADWILAERSYNRARSLISYDIGCEQHVTEAEARAVVRGSTKFHIEKLEDLAPEDAGKMR